MSGDKSAYICLGCQVVLGPLVFACSGSKALCLVIGKNYAELAGSKDMLPMLQSARKT